MADAPAFSETSGMSATIADIRNGNQAAAPHPLEHMPHARSEGIIVPWQGE